MSALADKDAAANLAVKNAAARKAATEGDHLIAYRSGSSTLLVYQSQYAGSNKATAVAWNTTIFPT